MPGVSAPQNTAAPGSSLRPGCSWPCCGSHVLASVWPLGLVARPPLFLTGAVHVCGLGPCCPSAGLGQDSWTSFTAALGGCPGGVAPRGWAASGKGSRQPHDGRKMLRAGLTCPLTLPGRGRPGGGVPCWGSAGRGGQPRCLAVMGLGPCSVSACGWPGGGGSRVRSATSGSVVLSWPEPEDCGILSGACFSPRFLSRGGGLTLAQPLSGPP